jgi:hypothetical protein
MRNPWVPLLALAASAPAAFALELVHDPVACAAPDRYVRIAARGVPTEAVAAGEVGFRAHPQSDWYTVAMAARDGEWTALIPRPTAALGRFEYRVALTGTDTARVTTQPLGVSVAVECPAVEGTTVEGAAVAAAIVVQVPPGAPAIPPVPPGFSPVGASSSAPVARTGGSGVVKALAGVGLAGLAGGVAIVAGGDDDSSDGEALLPPDIPAFFFERTIPGPGAEISAQRDTLQVHVRMGHQPRSPLDILWVFELLEADAGPVCAAMLGIQTRVQRSTGLVLSAPIKVSGACGTTFDVQATRLRLRVHDTVALDAHIGLPYKITP